MLVDLSNDDKVKVMNEGWNECLKNHLCGNYISIDLEGLEYKDNEWMIDTEEFNLIAFTEFGTYHYNYDFDFTFDENLNQFVEDVTEYLINCINDKD